MQTNSYRVDIGSLRPLQRMPDGRIIVDAFITRCGVFLYQNPDGTVRRELRDRSEVARPESLRTFEQLPVTNTHPFQAVTPQNARDHMVGSNDSSVSMDGDHVRTRIMVIDQETIDEMQRGDLLQVSCGYRTDYDPTPGTHIVYGAYDGRQTNIVGNHIALVRRGRAGDSVRVRMDAALESLRLDAAMMVPEGAVFTSIEQGHQHSVDPDDVSEPGELCCTSMSRSKGADTPHRHEWMLNADGSITISMVDGHTHTAEVKWQAQEQPEQPTSSAMPPPNYDSAPLSLSSFESWVTGRTPSMEVCARFDNAIADAHRAGFDPSAFIARNIGRTRERADVTRTAAVDAPCGTSAQPAKEIMMKTTGANNEKTETQKAAEMLAAETQRADGLQKKLDELTSARDAAVARADAAEGQLDATKKKLVDAEKAAGAQVKLDESQAAFVVLQKKYDALKLDHEKAIDPKNLAVLVADRAEIMSRARPHMASNVTDDVFARMDSEGMMRAACERLGQPIPSGKSYDYVRAVFMERTDGNAAYESALQRVRIAAAPAIAQQQRGDTLEDARAEMIERKRAAGRSGDATKA